MMLTTVTSSGRMKPVADRGLQRLAGAVLIQALQDASTGTVRCRREALDWIFDRSQTDFSFEFCCSLLGRDPKDVRTRIEEFSFVPRTQGGAIPGFNSANAA